LVNVMARMLRYASFFRGTKMIFRYSLQAHKFPEPADHIWRKMVALTFRREVVDGFLCSKLAYIFLFVFILHDSFPTLYMSMTYRTSPDRVKILF
jgi:hypothetical protein